MDHFGSHKNKRKKKKEIRPTFHIRYSNFHYKNGSHDDYL